MEGDLKYLARNSGSNSLNGCKGRVEILVSFSRGLEVNLKGIKTLLARKNRNGNFVVYIFKSLNP